MGLAVPTATMLYASHSQLSVLTVVKPEQVTVLGFSLPAW